MKEEDKYSDLTEDELAQKSLAEAEKAGMETAWDRLQDQKPQCGFGETGVCCNRCAMGPCQADPFEEGPERGVCGADADLIVARNLLADITAGAAAHSDHGREVAEIFQAAAQDETGGSYGIKDEDRLAELADIFDLGGKDLTREETAKKLAQRILSEFGTHRDGLALTERAPAETREIWDELGITPDSIGGDLVEAMHRTHMGVGAEPANMLLHGLKIALGDGWGGSMIATELGDVMFGTPEINQSSMNLGVIDEDKVNVIVHGHNSVLSEMVVQAAESEGLQNMAEERGAEGIKVVGLCCTGNEILMRRGIPMAGNMLNQELVLATGAVEAAVIDYQCIFPSLVESADCYHTEIITTSHKSKIPGAVHLEFAPESAESTAREIVKRAIENFSERSSNRVNIPGEPQPVTAGFSLQSITEALGGSLDPLIEAIKTGDIRGAVGIVGCNNPKIKQDKGHIELAKELLQEDILLVETGCAAVASGKEGLLSPKASELAGPGLRPVLESLEMPPVLHMGACVDCSRILKLAAALAREIGVGIHQLPLAGAAPEWYAQKAVAIGSYFVASGVYTVLGPPPKIFGSSEVVDLLSSGLEEAVGANFAVEPEPKAAAKLIIDHIESQREELGI
ncbi:anaerobic carbon-monoxide dehydrogenase catalytic subunit [Halarsenatibacter silvermanii]|uniref:Carbon monoxide dehydrogenase n=1 Tax=Halarsenatibacter silvermanii TaxID=321763 RepID=A0A1G9N3B5_9FIRM|nr:anaerobic carbon-monoxide dehydrogenase catalytic subunit [Halarsenatibacter silvermanii]SDL80988.1 Ni-dependent carbon monoxide dehydrogenase precursor [Halarsenatibacter silvermanii]